MKNGEILLYSDGSGKEFINVMFKDETFWLTQKAMAELFGCTSDNISLHLKNIFAEEELDKDSVAEKFSVTAADGKNYLTQCYNLDAIIAVAETDRFLSNNRRNVLEGRGAVSHDDAAKKVSEIYAQFRKSRTRTTSPSLTARQPNT